MLLPLKQIGSVITLPVNSAAATELNAAIAKALPFARGLILKPAASGIVGTIPAPDNGMLYREIFVANAGSYKMTVNGVGLPAGSFATAVLINGNFKLKLQAITSPIQLYDGGINVDPGGLVGSGNVLYTFVGSTTTDLAAAPTLTAPWGVVGPKPGFRAVQTSGVNPGAGAQAALTLQVVTHNINSLVTFGANINAQVNMKGLYRVSATVAYNATANNQRWAILTKNGTPVQGCAAATQGVNGTGQYSTPNVTQLIKLDATDILSLVALESSPAAPTINIGQYASVLSVQYVGPG